MVRGTDLFLCGAMQRRASCVLALLSVLIAVALCALPLANVQGQAREPRPHRTGDSLSSVEVLTPTEGVDFSAFLNHLMRVVRHNWYAMMPETAMLGEKGKVFFACRSRKMGHCLVRLRPSNSVRAESRWTEARLPRLRPQRPSSICRNPFARRASSCALLSSTICLRRK